MPDDFYTEDDIWQCNRLYGAMTDGDERLVRTLLRRGVKLNFADGNRSNQTVLHHAVRLGRPEMVTILLEWLNTTEPHLRKLLIDAQRNDGSTALHLAVTGGDRETVDLLLRYAADRKIANRLGQRPIDLPAAKENDRLRTLLQKASSAPPEVNAAGQEPSSPVQRSYTKGALGDLKGNSYQVEILALVAARVFRLGCPFRLATEMKDADKFDDVVVALERPGPQPQLHWKLLQVKHKDDPEYRITLDDLLRDEKGQFNLAKYFYSFQQEIKKKEIFREAACLEDLVLLTNAQLDSTVAQCFEEVLKHDPILDEMQFNGCFRGARLRLRGIEQRRLMEIGDDLSALADGICQTLRSCEELCRIEKYVKQLRRQVFDFCGTLEVPDGMCFENDVRFESFEFRVKQSIAFAFMEELRIVSQENETVKRAIKDIGKRWKQDSHLHDLDRLQQMVHATELAEQPEEAKLLEITKYMACIEQHWHKKQEKLNAELEKAQNNRLFMQYADDLKTLVFDMVNRKLHATFRTDPALLSLRQHICEVFDLEMDGFEQRFDGLLLSFTSQFRTGLPTRQMLIDHLKGTSSARRMVQELAKFVRAEKTSTWSPMMNTFSENLHMHILDVQTKRFKTAFVSGAADLPAVYANIRCDLIKQMQLSEEEFVAKYREKTFLFSKCMTNASTARSGELMEYSDSEVEEFLEKFSFAVKQPTQTSLSDLTTKHLSSSMSIELVPDLIYAQFIKEMTNLVMDKKNDDGYYYTNGEYERFQHRIKERYAILSASATLGELEKRIERSKLRFKEKLTCCEELINNRQQNLLHIINPVNSFFSMVKIVHTLQGMTTSNLTHITFEASHLEDRKQMQQIQEAFQCESTMVLLTLRLERPLNVSGEQALNKLTKMANGERKILLVTRDSIGTVPKAFLKYQFVDRDNAFANLDERHQQRMLSTTEVNFQGTRLPLGELLSKTTAAQRVIDDRTLDALCKSSILAIGSPPEVVKNYTERLLYSDEEEELSLTESAFIDDVVVNEGDKQLSTEAQVLLISAEPGAGKTTVLLKLAEELKRKYPAKWVLCVKLSQICDDLSESSNEFEKLLQKVACGDKTTTTTNPGSSLSAKIFQLYLQRPGSTVLFIDAFDEISPVYTEKVLQLIEWVCEKTQIVRTVVSSREVCQHLIREKFLKNNDHGKCYHLRPLSVNSKNYILRGKFQRIVRRRDSEWNERKFRHFSSTLLNSLGTITDLPQILHMCADVYGTAFLQFHQGTHDTTPMETFERVDIVDLYRRFIDMEVQRDSQDKGGLSLAKSVLHEHDEMVKEKIIPILQQLAMLTIFPEPWVRQYFRLRPEPELYALLQTKRSHRLGFVDVEQGGSVRFIHRTFVDFFVAEYMWKFVLNKPEPMKEKLIETILLTKNSFLYAIMALDLRQGVNFPVDVVNVPSVMELLWKLKSNIKTYDSREQTHAMTCSPLMVASAILEREPSIPDELFAATVRPWINYSKTGGLTEEDEMCLSESASTGSLPLVQRMIALYQSLKPGQQPGGPSDWIATSAFVALKRRYRPIFHELLHRLYTGANCYENASQAAIETKDKKKRTLLDVSIIWQRFDIVKYLTEEHGARIDSGIIPRAKNVKILSYLVQRSATPENKEYRWIWSMLAKVRCIDTLTVNVLFAKGFRRYVNEPTNDGLTPLQVAIARKNYKLAKILLERGALTAVVDANGQTPLHAVVMSGGCPALVEPILETFADTSLINRRDAKGKTALEYAINAGCKASVAILLAKGAFSSAQYNHTYIQRLTSDETIQRMMQEWIVANDRCNHSQKLLEEARTLLVKTYMNCDVKGFSDMQCALAINELTALQIADSTLEDVNAKDAIDRTTLHHVAESPFLNAEALARKWLAKANVDVDAQDYSGNTPAHCAARSGNVHILRLLEDNGANLDKPNDDGRTPRDIMRDSQFTTLPESPPLVNAADDSTMTVTPLHLALRNGNHNRALQLIEADLFLHQDDLYHRQTPLHIAAAISDATFTDVLEALLLKYDNIGQLDRYGKSALAYATDCTNKHSVGLLLYYGAQVTDDISQSQSVKSAIKEIVGRDRRTMQVFLRKCVTYKNYTTAIRILCNESKTLGDIGQMARKKMLEMIAGNRAGTNGVALAKLLLDGAKEQNAKDYTKAIEIALHTKNNAMVALLQAYGVESLKLSSMLLDFSKLQCMPPQDMLSTLSATPCIQLGIDARGRTALHVVVETVNTIAVIEIIKLLLSKGLRVNETDREGNTPLHYATRKGRIFAMKALLANGANVLARNHKRKTAIDLANSPYCKQLLQSRSPAKKKAVGKQG